MIPYVEFADNANERTPAFLVLDCSGSMRGEPIKQLERRAESVGTEKRTLTPVRGSVVDYQSFRQKTKPKSRPTGLTP